MKRTFACLAVCGLMIASSPDGTAQDAANGPRSNPAGSVVYALPRTAITLSVEAVRESYAAGPYARFSKKYLGIDVPETDTDTYRLRSVRIIPRTEADPELRLIADLTSLKNPQALTEFYRFSSQGLVVLSDDFRREPEAWRFPAPVDRSDWNGKGVTPNLTETETTVYRSVPAEGNRFDRIPVTQSQVVSNSLENKAAEAARIIFDLRKKRIQIITGDTDATFDGNALGDAVAEINRLEAEYLSLFLGIRRESTETLSFDVVPESGTERQLTIAFRISENEGILPPENVDGRPIVLELIPEEPLPAVQAVEIPAGRSLRKPAAGELSYRIPAICTARLSDGRTTLLQTRIPVYQMGQTLSFPLAEVLRSR